MVIQFMLIIILIVIFSVFLYFRHSGVKKEKGKKSKFTTIIHSNNNDPKNTELLYKSVNNLILIQNNTNSDISYLAFIIKYWENMPHYSIFLRDNDLKNKKDILFCLNGIDQTWGSRKYMNLEHFLKYICIVKSEDDNLENNKINKKVIETIKNQSVGIYQTFDYNSLQKGDFKIFWDIYMLQYFGELHNHIPKIMNIHKQSTTGQFIVYYKQFYWRPLDFYKSLFNYLKAGGINYLPILWDIILT